MEIQIDSKRLKIGEHSVKYSAYYFDVEEYNDLSEAAALKEILVQWAGALTNLDNGRALFLPFSLDDEWIECFKASQSGERITLKHVWVSEDGWSVDVSDLGEFMTSEHEIRKELPEVFGEYRKEDFILALLTTLATACRAGTLIWL